MSRPSRSSWSSRMMTSIALDTLGRQSCPLRAQCAQNRRMNVQRASVMTIPHELMARLMRSMRLLFPDSPGGMTSSLSTDMNLGMVDVYRCAYTRWLSLCWRGQRSSASKMAQLRRQEFTNVTSVSRVSMKRVGPELVWYTTGIPVVYQSRVTPLSTPKILRRFGFIYNVLHNTH